MPFVLYNSLSRRKEPFRPLNSQNVGLYVCGPTVYDRAHLGNARPVVIFDVLYRVLKHLYQGVTYVRNITDVDDKINAASRARGISIYELTTQTIAAYHEDMAALGALPPDYEPKATAFIEPMIGMINQLIEQGFAYVAEGHVLFEVKKYPCYGHLSHRSTEELLAGARIEVAPYKKDGGDFVLWKPSPPEQPGWDSPWGRGRPGWHIECSAMSAHYLGKTFDIHAGGIDLIFPHHENEIAQSCCAHGVEKMAHYWLHNGHLTVSGDKMSKSLGNFFTVKDLLERYDGEVIRLMLLKTHYRQPLDWQEEGLNQAKQTLDRWYKVLKEARLSQNSAIVYEDSVLEALEDDLNTPQALSSLHQIVHQFYKVSDDEQRQDLAQKLRSSAYFLGLLQKDPVVWFQSSRFLSLTDKEIKDLIKQRHQARQNRDFAKADAIRQQLLDYGIQLEDKGKETMWRHI